MPVSSTSFSFDGRLYRGSFMQADGGIVNLVDLEAYLCSVVSREMPPGWPPAALEAQAICARTYVLQRSDPRRSYDLVPSELDQRYDGIESETLSGNAAVAETSGAVLWYAGAFARVAYSSCCGGHTESSSDAWGNPFVRYLAGVVCTSCGDSPNYRWNRSLDLETIASSLGGELPPGEPLDDVRISARDGSGRARTLELVSGRNSTNVTGGAFRRAVGTRVLPSLLVSGVQRSPDGRALIFEGGGLGHGVGLCQWGARGMARSGNTAAQIVSYYFPGTVLNDLK